MSTHANEELKETLLDEIHDEYNRELNQEMLLNEKAEAFKQNLIRSNIQLANRAYQAFWDKES